MAQSCLKIVRINNLRNRVNRRILILRRFTRLLWSRIVACTPGKSRRYLLLSRALPSPTVSRPSPSPIPAVDVVVGGGGGGGEFVRRSSVVYDNDNSHRRSDSDLVSLKISLLGDPEIGKTSFLVRIISNPTYVFDFEFALRLILNFWEFERRNMLEKRKK